jgi:REP element-mobilizing transposase RayT
MRLSEFGRIVARAWDDLPSHYPTVELDAFIVMPNHVHGIIVLTNNEENGTVGAGNVMAQMIGAGLSRPNGTTPALGSVVAYFKYQSTKQINVFQGTPGIRVWQRNYFERIIRDSRELEGVRWYIAKNPSRWDSDRDPRVL